jgi:hypothetical protein
MPPVDASKQRDPEIEQVAEPARIEPPRVEQPPAVERRSAQRRKLALVVHLQFESVDAVFDSETVDISRTGVFLRTSEIRPTGTPARMSITVAGRKLVLHGTVVRVVQPRLASSGLGIAFDRPVVDDTGLLEQLLATKWTRVTTGVDH